MTFVALLTLHLALVGYSRLFVHFLIAFVSILENLHQLLILSLQLSLLFLNCAAVSVEGFVEFL